MLSSAGELSTRDPFQVKIEPAIQYAENGTCLKVLVRKRLAIFLIGIALLILTIGALSLAIWDRHAVNYNGRSLKEWAQLLRSPDSAAREEASAALRAMGTQAVPGLVDLVKTKDTGLRRVVWSAAAKLPRKARAVFFRKFPWPDPNDACVAGAKGLAIIGPEAQAAIPALARALRNPARQVSLEAAAALAHIGKAAVPALTEAVGDKKLEVRHAAVFALGEIGTDAETAIPLLVPLLAESYEPLRSSTVYSLSRIGPAEISFLISLLQNTSEATRESASRILVRYYAGLGETMPSNEVAGGTAPGIRETDFITIQVAGCVLKDPTPEVRLRALAALARLNSRSEALVGLLIQSLNDQSPIIRTGAARLLARMGPMAKSAVPTLATLLEDQDGAVRVAAADALRVIRPGSTTESAHAER